MFWMSKISLGEAPPGVCVLLHAERRDVPSERPSLHHRRRVEFRVEVELVKVAQMTRRDLAEGIDYIRKELTKYTINYRFGY